MKANKICSKCSETKPIEGYYTYARKKDGVRVPMAKCKKCHARVAQDWQRRNRARAAEIDSRYKKRVRHRRRLRMYGLTDVEFQAMEAAQQGQCLICQRFIGDKLHIDHDHATGQVRGLLCGPCNVGLGALGDDPVRLLRAIEYLEGARAFAAE